MGTAGVLVLDGQQRSALATVRALGRRGVPVWVGESRADCLAGRSRYCRGTVVLPSPEREPDRYVGAVADVMRDKGLGVLLPMTDITTATLLRERERLGNVALPCPSFATYDALSNKYRLFQKARALGLDMPQTVFFDDPSELTPSAVPFEYPVVLKPAYSRVRLPQGWLSTAVRFAHSFDELQVMVRAAEWLGHCPFMVQAYMEGEGQGLFALYDRGRPVVLFCHRRLREKPPSGGVSVLCESAPVDPRLRASAERLLGDVGWHGVAMVELKVSRDGTPYLMEVNGRFWGSLQLAVDAGVDFPYLAYQLANGEQPVAPEDYRVGVRSRWLMGDLDRLYLVLKDGAMSGGQKWREAWEFMKFMQRGTRFEVNRLGDMGPFWFEVREWLRALGQG